MPVVAYARRTPSLVVQYRISCRAFAAEAADCRGLRNGSFDQGDEAIAHARHGLDVLLTRRSIPERLPQHRYVVIEVVFLDGRLGPHRVEELLLRDQPPGMLDQHPERVEHLETQRDHVATARKATLADVEMKWPVPIRPSDTAFGQESHLRKVSEILQRVQRTPPDVRF